MGMALNIIVFCILFSYGLTYYCTSTTGSCPFTSYYSDLVDKSPNNLKSIISTLSAGAVVIALVGTLVFPNPYTLFVGVLASLYTFPINVVFGSQSGIPNELVWFGRIMYLCYLVAILSWYKGGDVP